MIGQGGKQVIVDFTRPTFIDSTTLGVLVGGVKRLRTNDGQLSLVCSDRNITKIFEITGLDRVFAIYGTPRGGRLEARRISQPSSLTCATLSLTRLYSCSSHSPRAGCGAVGRVTEGDPSRRQDALPRRIAASCHTLADAKSQGTIGPNLDDAFSSDRSQGFSEQTMRDLVRGQIAYPEKPMPANLVRGDDADDVAMYVAKCSGNPSCGVTASNPPPAGGARTTTTGGGAQAVDGKQVFSDNCASCHTLKEAAASGNVGPNLDQLKPSKATVQHQVEVGGGVMPAFKGTLSDAQIQAVADFVTPTPASNGVSHRTGQTPASSTLPSTRYGG